MESLGEVGVLMNMGPDSTGGEILKTLLSASKVRSQKPEESGVNVLHDLQNRSHAEEQLVLQIEVAEPIKSQFLPNNENVIQHIPITYLTTENSTLTPLNSDTFVEPVTYVLSRDMVADNRYCAIGRNEPEKIILVQEVDASTPQSVYDPEAKVFTVKERQSDQCEYSELWDVERSVDNSCAASGPNCKVIIKTDQMLNENKKVKRSEDSGGTFQGRRGMRGTGGSSSGSNSKVQKRISSCKKQLNKRKNSKLKSRLKTTGKGLVKKTVRPAEEGKASGEDKERQNLFELTKLEDNVDQVTERLKIGCECSDSNCFDGLNPDDVFKHRLNIADLTKAEHDMYLMGVIMASMHNLEETCRHKERIRIRSCYAYQGKKVCLTAFLYLQHVTLYQMKRLRSHLKNHGVSPRIHGNRGRKPANTLSLDIYRRATNFVQSFIEKHCVKAVPNFTTFSSNKIGNNSIAGTQDSKTNAKKEISIKIANKMTSYHLPPECTKRRVHREYKSFCENLKLSQKVMKYSTFTNFLKKQFPNVKFHKREEKKQDKKQEESERWKLKDAKTAGEEPERKSKEDQGVDKSIQVDKRLTYIPVKTQTIVDGGQLFDEDGGAETSYGVPDRVLVGSQSYTISQTQNTEHFYSINDTV